MKAMHDKGYLRNEWWVMKLGKVCSIGRHVYHRDGLHLKLKTSLQHVSTQQGLVERG